MTASTVNGNNLTSTYSPTVPTYNAAGGFDQSPARGSQHQFGQTPTSSTQQFLGNRTVDNRNIGGNAV